MKSFHSHFSYEILFIVPKIAYTEHSFTKDFIQKKCFQNLIVYKDIETTKTDCLNE